jgi:hypothetical protein
MNIIRIKFHRFPGNSIVAKTRALGFHYDPERKMWWVTNPNDEQRLWALRQNDNIAAELDSWRQFDYDVWYE